MHDLNTLVDDIRRQLEDLGVAPGTRSGQSTTNLKKVQQGDPKPASSREGRSVQQVINFSSPSFPA